eukprot:74654_1
MGSKINQNIVAFTSLKTSLKADLNCYPTFFKLINSNLLNERLPSVGDRVAAKVASHDLYILTQVEACNRNGTYIVRDADAQQGCRTYTLRRSVLLKLPKVNESTKGYFTVGRRVMAMYPRTTSFYPATVSAPAPRRDSNGLEMVEVQFDDDEDEYGELPKISIPAHFIGLPPSISS